MGKVPEKALRMVHFCVLSTIAHLKSSFQLEDTAVGCQAKRVGNQAGHLPVFGLVGYV